MPTVEAWFGTRCPRCGSEIACSVATADLIRCRYCLFEGPPAPEVTAALRQAGVILLGRDERERQLDERRMGTWKAVKSAERSFLGLTMGGAVLIVALAVLMICSLIFEGYTEENFLTRAYAPLVSVWAASVSVITLVAFIAMRRKRRTFEVAMAGAPGLLLGDPARCHACGGDLRGAEGDAVVRCSYCRSDNIVAPAVLKFASQRRETRLDRFEQSLAGRATVLQRWTKAGVSGWWGAVIASWCVCGCPTAVVNILVQGAYDQSLDVAPNEQYVLAQTDVGLCIARLRDEVGVVALDFGGSPEPTYSSHIPFNLESLRNQKVRIRRTGVIGDVGRLGFREDGGYVKVWVDEPYGHRERLRPHDLCLLQ